MKKIIQKIVILFMAVSIFSMSSCEELDELLKFDFDLKGEKIEFDVEPFEVGNDIVLGSGKFDKTLSQILQENAPKADINKITAINLKNIHMEIIQGADDDNSFQNLTELYAEVKATGLNNMIVAEVRSISSTATTKLSIPVKGGSVNLKDYFNKNNFEYVVKAKVHKASTKTLRVRATADYSFEFDLKK